MVRSVLLVVISLMGCVGAPGQVEQVDSAAFDALRWPVRPAFPVVEAGLWRFHDTLSRAPWDGWVFQAWPEAAGCSMEQLSVDTVAVEPFIVATASFNAHGYPDQWGYTYLAGESDSLLWTYDQAGLVEVFTSVSDYGDSEGYRREYDHDGSGGLTRFAEFDAVGGSEPDFEYTWSYNAEGNLISAREPPGSGSFPYTEWTWNADQVVREVAFADTDDPVTAHYAYEGAGLQSIVWPEGEIHFEWRDAEHLLSKTDTVYDAGFVNVWDADRLTQVLDPMGSELAHVLYDASGRPVEFVEGLSVTRLSWTADDQVAWVAHQGAVWEFERQFTWEDRRLVLVEERHHVSDDPFVADFTEHFEWDCP